MNAQRRSERLTDVPISITALSGDRLTVAGITSTMQLGQVTPGLLVSRTGIFVQPSIRGISNSLTAPGADNSVALYIDGVYQPAQGALAFELNNIHQVEVLKGPQGTLFGRNAAGGAILVSTYNPSFESEAKIIGSYGRFNEAKLNAYVNVPLVADLLAVNATFLYRREDNFSKNIFNGLNPRGRKDFVARGKLRFDPTNELSFILSAGYNKSRNDRFQATQSFNGNVTQNILNPALVATDEPYRFAHNEAPRFRIRTRDVSLHANLELPFGDVATISSYGEALIQAQGDYDYSSAAVTYVPLRDEQKTHSEEMTFSSHKFGSFSIVAGLYYYKDRASRLQKLYASSALPPFRTVQGQLTTTAYAAFAEVAVDITDKLHAIAGIRYSNEKKKAAAVQTGTTSAVLAPVSASFNAGTPRASLRYDLDTQSNLYFTFSKGFKSGTFNYTALSGTPVRPERVTAYELGYKRGGALRFSAAGYYYDYASLQVQSLLAFPVFTLQNAASAKIYGGEAELDWRISSAWTISGGAAYNHARYDSFPNALFTAPGANGINRTFVADASGNSLARAPEFTATLTPSWSHDLPTAKFGASATFVYSDGFYWNADNRIREPSTFKINALISVSTPDERYRFSIWGRNITNEHNLVTQFSSGVGDVGIFDDPATYGVSLAANF